MDPITAMYVVMALHGLLYGMLLFLVASGLTLIYGMMGYLNLSHAFFMMLAIYFCSSILAITDNYWISILLAPILIGLLGMLFERLFFRNLESGDLGYIGQILPTLGVALVIMTMVGMFWGSKRPNVDIPAALEGFVFVNGLQYPIYRLFAIGLTFIIFIVLVLILFKTRLGLIVRAAVSDAGMVNALGVNSPLVFTSMFGIGTWMAGMAGVVAAPLFAVDSGFAYQWSLDTFVVVIVGGLGNVLGAFVFAIVFGELRAYGVLFFPRLVSPLMFLVMAAVLYFKPLGLFGKRQ